MTVYRWLLPLGALLLQSCAATEQLFFDYESVCLEQKSPVAPAPVVIEKNGSLWEPAVYFDFDKDTLSVAEKARLDHNIKVLRDFPDLQISVQAFTDLKGSVLYNDELAKNRGESVIRYFLEQGIDETRVKVSSYGKALPILNGLSNVDGMINRRVELMLLDADGRPVVVSVHSNGD